MLRDPADDKEVLSAHAKKWIPSMSIDLCLHDPADDKEVLLAQVKKWIPSMPIWRQHLYKCLKAVMIEMYVNPVRTIVQIHLIACTYYSSSQSVSIISWTFLLLHSYAKFNHWTHCYSYPYCPVEGTTDRRDQHILFINSDIMLCSHMLAHMTNMFHHKDILRLSVRAKTHIR